MTKSKVFITGGAGYIGSCLVPILLDQGYKVTVFDIMYFGSNFLPKENSNLKIINGDIRNSQLIEDSCKNHDFFIHLACISNDTSFVLDEKLSTSVNLHAFEPMVKSAKKNGISRFIYASTSSVYGISKEKNITEDHPLVPITLYNEYKGMCEPILLNNTSDSFEGVVFRPATVCGYAPRQRLDLSVNILTNYAVNKREITVFGGDQLRPNLHILDYCDAVLVLLKAESSKIKNQIFNIGYQNLSIIDIAKKVKKTVLLEFPKYKNIEIKRTKSDDVRSYHIDSTKIKEILEFEPKRTIEDAIKDLCNAFKNNLLKNTFDDEKYFNVKQLQKLNEK